MYYEITARRQKPARNLSDFGRAIAAEIVVKERIVEIVVHHSRPIDTQETCPID